MGRQADQKNARSLQNNLSIYMKFECEITALKGTYKTVKVEKNSTVARVFCHLFFKTHNESNLFMVTEWHKQCTVEIEVPRNDRIFSL